MASKNKNVLLRDTGARTRDFKYSLGNVSLDFSLRTDTKTGLKDFAKLLEQALVDVKEEIARK